MDNHPIPQDVTGFKFKLIGSITIKQFGYLMAAGVFALIIWLLPIAIFVKIPIILIPAGLALVLAFVPIEGRPADKMIVNFVKALPSENQYIYHKKGVNLDDYEVFKPVQLEKKGSTQSEAEIKKKAVTSALRNSYFRPDKQEMESFQNVKDLFENAQEVARPVTMPVISADAPNTKPVALPNNPNPTPQKTIQDVPQSPQPPATTGFTLLPDVGNVVMGTVQDPRGKAIPNVLVEIMDKNNTPVRSFKTNLKGQFAAATPLQDGEYRIFFDDPQKQQEFAIKEITLDGQIFQPITITSVDQREKLRRDLFG